MKLKGEINKIIQQEDKKNPFTDKELAKKLNTTRETITVIRNELNIPDSRGRREPMLIEDIKNILSKDSEISVAALTKNIQKNGYNVSRNIVLKAYCKVVNSNENVIKKCSDDDPFKNLIGYNQSLKSCIVKAKAAMLYPPFGLSTLITGESGTGKTYFVNFMYKFAVKAGVLNTNSPYKVLNCADYADNPQLLMSILFGYKKGAFTGAEKDTVGIVEQANNGMLFLDEIHRLPPKGQEILFSILDNGKFRRLGETSDERNANIIFTGATTEDINSSLLLSFRRRISMIISVPSLKERDISEKIELIHYFFQQECNRVNKKIYVEGKVIETLLLRKYPGNIGQLKSEIKVICARVFMKSINDKSNTLNIELNDLICMYKFNENDLIDKTKSIYEINKLAKDIVFIPQEKYFTNKLENTDDYISESFYDTIEKKYNDLKNLKLDNEAIEKILFKYISNQFEKIKFPDKSSNKKFSLNKLVELVNSDILMMVKNLRTSLYNKFPNTDLNENVFAYLAIHLDEAIKRVRLNIPSIDANIVIKDFSYVKKKYPQEYDISQNFADILGSKMKVNIPKEEVNFITLYIKAVIENDHIDNKVGIVVICHGHVATEIINVVKTLLNEDFPIAIDMPLEENPINIYDKVCKIVNMADKGNGILFFVDMGSLNNIGEMVSKKFGIKTRVIDRADTLTVLEAVRKASLSANSLDDIYFSLLEQKYEINYPYMQNQNTGKPKAILAVCITGIGAAIKINEFFKSLYSNLNIFSIGISDPDMNKKVENIQKNFEIVAAVGTINPEIKGINFIPFDSKFFYKNKTLEILLNNNHGANLIDLVEEDLILMDPCFKSKEDLIENMCLLLVNKGYVKKDYYEMVIKREKIQPTFFKWGVAVPHAEPQNVINSSVVFAKLKTPVSWGVGKVSIVCLPAIKYRDKQIISQLFSIFSTVKSMQELNSAKTKFQFKTILLQNLQGGSK